MKNARRIARKPTLVGLGQLGASGDPDHHDVFPGGRAGVPAQRQGHPASRHRWSHDVPFRVHYYDAKLTGTWHHYFDDYERAREFAVTRTIYGRPCIVEQR